MLVAYAACPLVVLALLLGWWCRTDIRRLVSGMASFLALLIAWYAAEFAFFPPALQQYSSGDIGYAELCLGISLAGFLVGYFLRRSPPAFPSATGRALSSTAEENRLWAVFLTSALVGLLPLLWIAEGNLLAILQDAFLPRKRWSSVFQRARYGDLRDALLELQMFLRASMIVACAILFSPRPSQSWGRRAACLTIVVYCIARALNDGSRIAAIEIMLPIAAAIYWVCPGHWKTRLLWLGGPFVSAVAILWAVATCVGRDEGQFSWESVTKAHYTGFEMSRELLFLTTHVPDESPYLWGRTYWVQIVNPIPRFAWTEKPREDAGLRLARLQGQLVDGEPKLTVAPGLIGEMYWNFGLPGVGILSGLLGWLVRWWDDWGAANSDRLIGFLIYTSGLGIIFVSGRSLNASHFYGLIALTIAMSLVRVCRRASSDPSDG